MDLNLQNLRTFSHMQDLIRFRNSGITLDAANDWLDKEISDLQAELEGKTAEKKRSPGMGPGRSQALLKILVDIIPHFARSRKGAGRFGHIQGRYRADKLRRNRRGCGDLGDRPCFPST